MILMYALGEPGEDTVSPFKENRWFFSVQNFLKFSLLVSLWSVEPARQVEAGISEVEEQQGCAVRITTNSSFTRERETQGQGLSSLSSPSQPWQKQHKHTH